MLLLALVDVCYLTIFLVDYISPEAWKEYKKSRQNAKRIISLAKRKKQKECASVLNDLTI